MVDVACGAGGYLPPRLELLLRLEELLLLLRLELPLLKLLDERDEELTLELRRDDDEVELLLRLEEELLLLRLEELTELLLLLRLEELVTFTPPLWVLIFTPLEELLTLEPRLEELLVPELLPPRTLPEGRMVVPLSEPDREPGVSEGTLSLWLLSLLRPPPRLLSRMGVFLSPRVLLSRMGVLPGRLTVVPGRAELLPGRLPPPLLSTEMRVAPRELSRPPMRSL